MSDTYILTVSKLQALATRGIETAFPSITKFPMLFPFERPEVAFDPSLSAAALGLQDVICSKLPVCFFDLHPEVGGETTNWFRIVEIGLPRGNFGDGDFILCSTHRTSIFNRRHTAPDAAEAFVLRPSRAVQNHLVFQFSQLGELYYGGDYNPVRTGLHPLEQDFWYPDRTMAGCGRHHLYLVLNPSETVRLQVDLTASLAPEGGNRLPPAAAIGDVRRPFPMVGRGSARVFSPPFKPQFHAGHPFVALDMGATGCAYPEVRRGLMGLYGKRFPTDRRQLVCFLRDVSLVSEDEYAALRPPSRLTSFPADLRHPDLEFSGIYEDGWVSEHAFFHLGRPGRYAAVCLRGFVPEIDDPRFTTDLVLLVDGAEVCRRTLAVGNFDIRLPVECASTRPRVEVRFSRSQQLGGGDHRLTAAMISEIGLTPLPSLRPPTELRNFPADLQNPTLKFSGAFADGWATRHATFELSSPSRSTVLTLRGEVPSISDPKFTTELTILLDGAEVARRKLGIGAFDIRLPVSVQDEARTRVELRFSQAQRLPSGDGRDAAALLAEISLTAAPDSSARSRP